MKYPGVHRLAATCALALAACGDDTTITVIDGSIPASPTTCDRAAGAEILGELDADTKPIQFGNVDATLIKGSTDMPSILLLGTTNKLDFYLPSQQLPAVGEYSYTAHAFTGQTTTVAQRSRFIVDASDPMEPSCLAGRFEVTFEGRGTLYGWFRVP